MRQEADERRSSTDRKRLSSSDGHDLDAKRRTVDVPGKSTSSKSCYGDVHTPSYPISALHYFPSQRDTEFSNGTYSSHPRRPLPGNCTSPVQSTKGDTMGRFGFPSFERSPIEEGYPGQFDSRDNPHGQQSGNMGRRNSDLDMPPVPLCSPPRIKQNRFNLSRYQLDENDEFVASLPASEPKEKPNRFKTQRERLMLEASAERISEVVSGSTGPSVDKMSLSHEDSDSSSESRSQSQDSYMSQRERLRRFSSEHSRHVVIPNEWQGETELQEFVAFGNIEAALRPLGLMMARAALVSDSNDLKSALTTIVSKLSTSVLKRRSTVRGRKRTSFSIRMSNDRELNPENFERRQRDAIGQKRNRKIKDLKMEKLTTLMKCI